MGFTDQMKADGFKAEENTEGEWKPYKGTYEVTFDTARIDTQESDGAKYLLVELSITATLDGDQKRDSKYADFNRRVYLDSDKTALKMGKLANDVLTFCGIDADTSSDDAFIESIQGAVGKTGYVNAWGFKPKDAERSMQLWKAVKDTVALKKKKADAVPF